MSVTPSVRLEGGLLGADLVAAVAKGEAPGQGPKDFNLGGTRVTDEIARAWADARAYWNGFNHRLDRLSPDDPATSSTREQWLLPLFGSLGYDDVGFQRRAADADGASFAISHRVGGEDGPPLHLVGARQPLDRRSPEGQTRVSPHALLQEYLNRTEHLWGVVSNGYQVRLLRNSGRTVRPSYVEFDLHQLMDAEAYSDFALVFRLLHRTRLPKAANDSPECLLEQYHQTSVEQGGRVRDKLRDGVEAVLVTLGTGFLRHPASEALRADLATGRLTAAALYRELLYVVYRLLFLLVAEDRGLVSAHATYRDHYSVARLRRLAEARGRAAGAHEDRWPALKATFRLFEDQDLGDTLAVAPLNGELFARRNTANLDAARIANEDLLDAVYRLTVSAPERGSAVPQRVNYAALDVEELGSVYESLLDFQPHVDIAGRAFVLAPGLERKSTGSYYTRPDLVGELVRTALEPVMDSALAAAATPAERERALLALNVCDPATGSGHFLLAAARRLGRELARVRTGEQEPAPAAFRESVRDVIGHCIYGVDLNPLAVDLCKVALWLEGHAADRPLTFLDHRIKCGNSLVGVLDMECLKQGIPDGAYQAVTGDDKAVATALRKRNATERKAWESGQMGLWDFPDQVRSLGDQLRDVEDMPDATLAQVRAKEAAWSLTRERGTPYVTARTAADLWTAAFFAPLTLENRDRVPTSAHVRAVLESGVPPPDVVDAASALARQPGSAVPGPGAMAPPDAFPRKRPESPPDPDGLGFFHWPLEFPDVFDAGGFDAVLSNPPWDMLQAEQQEWFAGNAPEVAALAGSQRQRAIDRLTTEIPDLHARWSRHVGTVGRTSNFVRAGGRYLDAEGRLNLYALFATLANQLMREQGQAGIIVPTGIATDYGNRQFFGDIMQHGRLVSLYDFANGEGLFPNVHRSYKFSLITLRGRRDPAADADPEFAFFATRLDHLKDPERRFRMSAEQMARINPNTLTCPVFRTRADAELTAKIYERVPVLVNERTGENPWGVSFRQGLFNMTSDSHLFRRREELEAQGFELAGNWFVRGEETYLPLYEAKMIWHYDHRYGTYEGFDGGGSHLPKLSDEDHADPTKLPLPRYWVAGESVTASQDSRAPSWVLGFRNVTRTTDERTAVFAAVPAFGFGHGLPFLAVHSAPPHHLGFTGALTSLVLDYVARQKLGGVNFSFFYVAQLPVLTPAHIAAAGAQLCPRALELVYTSWDLAPLADDAWRGADAVLRTAIEAQWLDNVAVTGVGHRDAPAPAWLAAMYRFWGLDPRRPDGFPFSPFKWDPARRAVLQAEIDAIVARLYGLSRDDLRYILDPAEVYGPDFPGETFRVLKEKEAKVYGEYRTKRLVTDAWDRLALDNH